MDYETIYKRSIETAKYFVECGHLSQEEAEAMFPELAESEDERIRKVLCDIVRDMPYMETELRAHGLTVEKTIAYLEKQKEQKPILEVFGFKVGDAVRLKDGDGRKHIIKSFEEIKGVHGPNFYHVEFEDDSARDGIYPGEEYPNGYYTQMEKFEEEQKSTELPKGENYGIDGLYAAIDILQKTLGEVDGYQTDDGILEHKCAISAVKELYEQQSAEWSEDDEKSFNDALSGLKYAYEDLTNNKSFDSANDLKRAFNWMQERFKSFRLQPHYKPSEEQMETLKSYAEDSACLNELYDDLKKL